MSVETILQALAESSGRAALQRGAILGGTIQQIAALPQQIHDDREHAALVQQQQDRLKAQDARAAAQDQRQAAADARDQAKAQQAEQERQDRGAIMATGL